MEKGAGTPDQDPPPPCRPCIAGNANKHAKANKEMINACMLRFLNGGGNENRNRPFTISVFKEKHAS